MLASLHQDYAKGATEGNAHQCRVVPSLAGRNGPDYVRRRSICLDGMNPLPMWVLRDHTQYSVGRTSERRALVVWITLSITDTVTEGTVPTPNLNAFSWWILAGANLSRGLSPHWVGMVWCGPTHTPLFFQLANWGEPKVLHAIKTCQIQEVFHNIALLTCSSSSHIFYRLAGHKAE